MSLVMALKHREDSDFRQPFTSPTQRSARQVPIQQKCAFDDSIVIVSKITYQPKQWVSPILLHIQALALNNQTLRLRG